MVNLTVFQEMQRYYEQNLARYVIEHGGEYLELDPSLKETFYTNKDQWVRRKEDFKRMFGTTPLFMEIPTKIPGGLEGKVVQLSDGILIGNPGSEVSWNTSRRRRRKRF
ncbi:hypothetical protein D6774_01815 [Candidatus Woesearchaeota archaeon]|nr:MAG: hypothetical protein D6774_01815 [Candidatus Woesearchaeota archaeon]